MKRYRVRLGEQRVERDIFHRIGIVVAEDLYFFEVMKSLALCGCDWVVCPFGGDVGEMDRVMLRAILKLLLILNVLVQT